MNFLPNGLDGLSEETGFRFTLALSAVADLTAAFTTLLPNSLLFVVPNILSLGTGASTVSVVLTTVTTWVLFTVGFALFAPKAYPSLASVERRALGFRALFGALATTSTFLAWKTAFSPDINGAIGVLLAGSVLLAVYVEFVRDWQFDQADPRWVELFRPFVEASLGGPTEAEGADGYVPQVPDTRLGQWLFRLAVGGLLCVPAYLLGIAGRVLLDSFPLPDLIALSYVGWGILAAFGVAPSMSAERFDLESRLYEFTRFSMRSVEGFVYAVTALIGATLVVQPALYGFRIARTLDGTAGSLELWVTGSATLLLVGAGGIGLWTWFQLLNAEIPVESDPSTWRPGDSGQAVSRSVPVAGVVLSGAGVVLAVWPRALHPLAALWPIVGVGFVVRGRDAQWAGGEVGWPDSLWTAIGATFAITLPLGLLVVRDTGAVFTVRLGWILRSILYVAVVAAMGYALVNGHIQQWYRSDYAGATVLGMYLVAGILLLALGQSVVAIVGLFALILFTLIAYWTLAG